MARSGSPAETLRDPLRLFVLRCVGRVRPHALHRRRCVQVRRGFVVELGAFVALAFARDGRVDRDADRLCDPPPPGPMQSVSACTGSDARRRSYLVAGLGHSPQDVLALGSVAVDVQLHCADQESASVRKANSRRGHKGVEAASPDLVKQDGLLRYLGGQILKADGRVGRDLQTQERAPLRGQPVTPKRR